MLLLSWLPPQAAARARVADVLGWLPDASLIYNAAAPVFATNSAVMLPLLIAEGAATPAATCCYHPIDRSPARALS